MKHIITLTLFFLAVIQLSAQNTVKSDTLIEAQPGELIEGFYLLNIDGMYFAPQDFPDAKGFIIIFTCNHCPYSQAYESRIIELDKKYSPKGFPVIAINPNDPKLVPDDSYEKMKERADENGYPFPYLLDTEGKYAKSLGAAKTPHVFVTTINERGLKVEYVGAIDDNSENALAAKRKYVESAVDALLANKPVILPKTKAIGCSIKYSKK